MDNPSGNIIRHLSLQDRNAFLKLGADTAYFGAPIEAYFDDRNLFLDAFYTYYTDIEPGYSWVAVAGGSIVGFLAGSADPQKYKKGIYKKIIPLVLGRMITGKYQIQRKTWNYPLGLLWSEVKTRSKPVDLKHYPAHLHINLSAERRSQGVGKSLINHYLDQLREGQVPGVHLNTTSQNSVACQLYEKMGFYLFSKHPNWFWSRWFGHQVDDLCYTKTLP